MSEPFFHKLSSIKQQPLLPEKTAAQVRLIFTICSGTYYS